MADSRIAFLTGCALTGAMAFAVAKGWINLDTQALTSSIATSDGVDSPIVEDMPLDGELPPPPPPASSLNSVPMSSSAMAKLEEKLQKQTEQNSQAIASLREDFKEQQDSLEKLQDKLSGQDEALTTMALDDKLSEMVAERNGNTSWSQGVLWALGGMVLTVSSIVMAGVFAMMARNNRDRAPRSQPFHSIRVVPSYLPGREHPELVTPRRPNAADYIDYDY